MTSRQCAEVLLHQVQHQDVEDCFSLSPWRQRPGQRIINVATKVLLLPTKSQGNFIVVLLVRGILTHMPRSSLPNLTHTQVIIITSSSLLARVGHYLK